MSRTLNLTGFQIGDSLSLSVAQGALTAGPVNVLAWGGGPSGGTITINAERSIYQAAPDSVRFTVDLDSSTFDTSGPAGDEVYDARLHDLIFLWDFDDTQTGDWTAPENVLPAWKNRNTAKGPFVAHMYTSPGTYNASVLVLEPSSGKQSTADVEIVVADPDTVYGGSGTYPDTICINPVGDNDFSGEPSGALRVNVGTVTNTDSWWTNAVSDNRPKRILLKRGAEFDFKVDVGSMNAGLYFGAYGSGAKPIANAPQGTVSTNCLLYSIGNYARNGANELWEKEASPDIRISNIDFRGGFDPTTMTPLNDPNNDPWRGIWFLRGVHWMISACDFDGLNFVLSTNQNLGDKTLLANIVHLDDCSMTNFAGQYSLFFGQTFRDDSAMTLTGCRLAQAPSGIEDASLGTRAIVRNQWTKYSHVRGCDLYLTERVQPCLKMIAYSEYDGHISNIHSNSFEGGSYAFWFAGAGATTNRNMVGNIVADGNIYVGAHASFTFVLTTWSGLTIRNNLVFFGEGKTSQGHGDFLRTSKSSGTGASGGSTVTDAPISLFNNTLLGLRTTSQQAYGASMTSIVSDNAGWFTNIAIENNVLHLPNQSSPTVTYAPLDNAEELPWEPRNPGWRPNSTKVLDPSYATPTHKIPYDGGTVDFTSGKTATDGTATGTVVIQEGTTVSGWLYLRNVVGTFSDDLPLTETDGPGAAVVNGAPVYVGPATYRPKPGSSALGAALTGNVSYMDIKLNNRPEPPSIGAWEVE